MDIISKVPKTVRDFARSLLSSSTPVQGSTPRVILVGGAVRDMLLGGDAKDFDIELFGLDPDHVIDVLKGLGFSVDVVGVSFGVIKTRLGSLDLDLSFPRRDSKVRPGHQGFDITVDPTMTFDQASLRRDFTIGAMGLDLVTGDLLDPHGGLKDLQDGVLRHVSDLFSDDPLRVLRAVQFAARFSFTVHPDTARISRRMIPQISHLSKDRIWGQFDKLLTSGVDFASGFQALSDVGLLDFFPQLRALVGLKQSPKHHHGHSAWDHTVLAVGAV